MLSSWEITMEFAALPIWSAMLLSFVVVAALGGMAIGVQTVPVRIRSREGGDD
jgi:hypothetical protein